MAAITEHDVINTYFDLGLGPKFQTNQQNKYQLGCIEVFANRGIEIDISTSEKQNAFKPYELHYKYVVTKIQTHLRSGKEYVFKKFPDKTKPFYLPSTNDIFVKSAPMETDEYELFLTDWI